MSRKGAELSHMILKPQVEIVYKESNVTITFDLGDLEKSMSIQFFFCSSLFDNFNLSFSYVKVSRQKIFARVFS